MIIKTKSGHIILADDADHELLGDHTWCVTSRYRRAYARTRIGNEMISMHRLLMQPPSHLVVHHKNNDGLDNRRSNLEITTILRNNRYARDGKETGAYLRKNGKWTARVRRQDGRIVNLGTHASKEAALAAVSTYKTIYKMEMGI